MTPAPWQGTRPPSRVRHGWQCVQRGPLVETVRTDALGRPHIVEMCSECEATDLAARVTAEAADRGGST